MAAVFQCVANRNWQCKPVQGNAIPHRQEMQAMQFKGMQFDAMQLLITIGNARQCIARKVIPMFVTQCKTSKQSYTIQCNAIAHQSGHWAVQDVK